MYDIIKTLIIDYSKDTYTPNMICICEPDKRRMGRLIRKLRRLQKEKQLKEIS